MNFHKHDASIDQSNRNSNRSAAALVTIVMRSQIPQQLKTRCKHYTFTCTVTLSHCARYFLTQEGRGLHFFRAIGGERSVTQNQALL